MTTHEWRERDDDDNVVFYRASHHAGHWTFRSKPKKAEDWTLYNDSPPIEVLESFREVLWNKIQRRRAPEKLLDQIDTLLEDRREQLKVAEEEE